MGYVISRPVVARAVFSPPSPKEKDNSLAHDTQGSWPLLGNRTMGASQAETSDSSTRASGKIEFSTQS